jgi:hypothetical protein
MEAIIVRNKKKPNEEEFLTFTGVGFSGHGVNICSPRTKF